MRRFMAKLSADHTTDRDICQKYVSLCSILFDHVSNTSESDVFVCKNFTDILAHLLAPQSQFENSENEENSKFQTL